MFMETRKTATLLIVVCTIIVLTAITIAFLLTSEAPESEPATKEVVPVTEPVTVTGSETAKDVETENLPLQDNTFTAPWGSAQGKLGRRVPEEGAPEGPMSFTVAEDGKVYVLDQINQRVQIFENGKFSREITIPGDTFQDLAVGENGRIVLLDRLAQKAVVFLEPEQRIPLEGPHVPEGGGVTGMFVNDGVWVEVEHRKLVRVAGADGKADPDRPWLDGRHTADGAYLVLAALDGRLAVNITLKPIDSAGAPVVRRVEFNEKILFLTALESDPEGNIYLGARLEKTEVLVIISPDGPELGRVALPVAEIELEQFRALRMGQDGGIYQLHFAESGARLRRIEW